MEQKVTKYALRFPDGLYLSDSDREYEEIEKTESLEFAALWSDAEVARNYIPRSTSRRPMHGMDCLVECSVIAVEVTYRVL